MTSVDLAAFEKGYTDGLKDVPKILLTRDYDLGWHLGHHVFTLQSAVTNLQLRVEALESHPTPSPIPSPPDPTPVITTLTARVQALEDHNKLNTY